MRTRKSNPRSKRATFAAIDALERRVLMSTVNAAAPVAGAMSNLSSVSGVNLTWWDKELMTAQTREMVQSDGLSLFRFPGGSSSDGYHFNLPNNFANPINDGADTVTNSGLGITASAVLGDPDNTIPKFAQFIEQAGGTGLVTLDYGSGSPQEAEAELAYLAGSVTDSTPIGNGIEWNDSLNSGKGAWQTVNWQTVGYWASLRASSPIGGNTLDFLRINHAAPFSQIKYWEVGNEEFGKWEIDHHGTVMPDGTSTGSQHNSVTYAAFTAAFGKFVQADQKNLPHVLIGIDSEDPWGGADNSWTRNVLTDCIADSFAPTFISDHAYPQYPSIENDANLLNNTVTNPTSTYDWISRYNVYAKLIQQVGLQPANVPVVATEFNSVSSLPGKQSTSLVNGLFLAESLGTLMDSGYSGGIVWDLRFGWFPNDNNSSHLYGWRMGGDFGLFGDPNPTHDSSPSTGPYIPYPSYFAEQLVSKIAQPGGQVVSTSSGSSDLSVYAVKETNGHLDLMVINKNSTSSVADGFNITGFQPASQAQFWQYGQAEDTAQSHTSNGSASLTAFSGALSLTGSNFSYTFPAYSMTVIDLSPGMTTGGGGTIRSVAGTRNLVGIEGSSAGAVLATFNDSNPNALADLSATINWGDGAASTAGSITFNSVTGSYQVSGSHTYKNPSYYFPTITIMDTASGTAQAGAKIYVADAPLHPFAASIGPVAGNSFTGVVGSFTDSDPNRQLSFYTATIDWGDGHVSAGTIALNSTTQRYDVSGTNTYASGGSYAVTLSIHDYGGMTLNIHSTASASVSGTISSGGGGGSITSATGVNGLVSIESWPVGGVLAGFSDSNANALADLQASVNWGDGSAPTAGTVNFNSAAGNFQVSATHIYKMDAYYFATISITDSVAGSAQVTDKIYIADAPFHPFAATFSATAGQNFTGVAGSFTDSDANAQLSYYSATIDWGDGHTSAGTVVLNSVTHRLNVMGSNTYASAGTYAVAVMAREKGGMQVTIHSTASVGGVAALPAALPAITPTTVATATDISSPIGTDVIKNHKAARKWKFLRRGHRKSR